MGTTATFKTEPIVPGETRQETVTKLIADGLFPLSTTALAFAGQGVEGFDGGDLTTMHQRISEHAKQASAGDLGHLERMLSAQADTLNILFCELMRRAGLNMGQHLQAVQIYMGLALRAQAQCRCAVEVLNEIKNPRSVAFVRAGQANVTTGPQQVNNGTVRTEAAPVPQNKLFQDERHEHSLDTRATPAPARGNPAMEAVGEIDRATDARGQGCKRRE